jgi:glycosyltransferase involved in cell wall biosynthesis
MSYLLITQDFPPGFIGGIAAWATDLASALHGAGHDVTVLCRNTKHSRGPDSQQPYRIVRMIGRSWSRFQGTWAHLHARRFLAPDVHVLTATWNLATELIGPCANKGATLSVAFHGSDLTQVSEPTKGLTEVAAAAKQLLPVSRFLAGELARLVPDTRADPRVQILPMPLPIPAAPPAGPRSGLLSVTRLTPLKGVDRAIRLAAELGETLTVVGDGPEKDQLPDGPHVTWVGRKSRDELAAMYARAKGVVLLPRATEDGMGAEGLGLCLLEAAAQGAIPIGWRIGGVAEAVGPGLLLDDPDRYDVPAIQRTLDDPSLPAKCHAFVARTHGPERTLQVLTRP